MWCWRSALGTLALFGLAALGSGQALRPLTPAERQGLQIWDQGQAGYRQLGNGNVRFFWQVRFKNETPHEVGSIAVRLVADIQGRRAYGSPTATLSRFRNISVPHLGSLLPYNKSEPIGGLSFDMPNRLWTTATRLQLELVSASTFRAPVDLHDAGHLYTKLVNSREPEIIALFKKDPTLLKVRNADNFGTLLMTFGACSPGVIEYVGSHGGNYGDRSVGGSTIMHLAAINGYPGALDVALKHGGRVGALTKGMRTPLVKAIVHGMPIGWQWLLKHGADPSADPAKAGWPPAHAAIEEGQVEALRALVKAGAKPTGHDANGDGWMHYAVTNDVMLDTVLRLGVPVDDRNTKNGMTPLQVAARYGYVKTQAWLLEHGANPDLKDRAGRTAYDYAKLSNTLHTDRFLRELVGYYRRR